MRFVPVSKQNQQIDGHVAPEDQIINNRPIVEYEGDGKGIYLPGKLVKLESKLRMNVIDELSPEAKEKVSNTILEENQKKNDVNCG